MLITFLIVSFMLLAFSIGVFVAHRSIAIDKQTLTEEVAEARAALIGERAQSAEQKRIYESRLANAADIIESFDEILEEIEKRREGTQSAIILPFGKR
jgi:hypothetical protein